MVTKKMSDVEREVVFAEFHSLLAAGLDFSHSFSLLIDGESNKIVKEVLEKIYQSVVHGDCLWRAFEKSGRFSALDCGVIRIGEETGRLDESLKFLSEYYSSAVARRRMLIGAVSYPLIIISVALVVMIFMVAVIVPMFEQVYARMGGELPAITRWIIAVSKNFQAWAFGGVCVVVAIVVFLRIYGKREEGERFISQIVLCLPVVGDLLKINTQARFCKLLYLLSSSGVSLFHGLRMLEDIITFYPYRKSFGRMCEGLNRGESLADIMERDGSIYSRKLVVLVRVGEQTNRLAAMLNRQAVEFSSTLEFRIKQVGSTLEPLLILFVGAIVAVILIAMYMPMFRMGMVIN